MLQRAARHNFDQRAEFVIHVIGHGHCSSDFLPQQFAVASPQTVNSDSDRAFAKSEAAVWA
jgi:hypothetical protein